MQIMKRTIHSDTETVNQSGYDVQISYNSDNRLAVRYKDPYNREKDILVVFDNTTSKKMIEFCQKLKQRKDYTPSYKT